jgi:hypothetical protein
MALSYTENNKYHQLLYKKHLELFLKIMRWFDFKVMIVFFF